MRRLHIDIETFSKVNLKTAGLYKYAADCELLLVAVGYDKNPVILYDLTTDVLPEQLVKDLQDPAIIKIAHNAAFEIACLSACLGIYLDPAQWLCSMVLCGIAGLPFSLDQAGSALNLDIRKDKEGTALIRYWCIPCKGTKANYGRVRNLPIHDLVKWFTFGRYCVQDVYSEIAITEHLTFIRIPPIEKLVWNLDQRINAGGIKLNLTLVRNAIEMDAEFRKRLIAEAVSITKLSNPNSVPQLIKWLEAETAEEIDNLRKAEIPKLIERFDEPVIKRVLTIRQELSKTSVKKYAAMLQAAGSDNRVRGLLQYYGANRTGRWGGRLIQPQNLPKGKYHDQDLNLAREIVLKGNAALLEVLFGAIPDTLSQLIRTAFIPAKGKKFVISDYSAIEARVIAWLAGERWRLEVFATHGRIYEASASQMFKVPIEAVTKTSDYRAKGKIAELACIAEGELVLTHRGLIPIENIKEKHLLWDGENWVRHKGLIYKGVKKVIEYDGLKATENHIVWVEGQSRPIHFGESARSGYNLLQSGNGKQRVWTRENNKRGKTMGGRLAKTIHVNAMQRLRICAVDKSLQFNKGSFKRLSKLQPASKTTFVVRQALNSSKATMRKSKRQGLPKLRSQGRKIYVRFGYGSRAIPIIRNRFARTIPGIRPYRQFETLRKREFKICNKACKPSKSEINSVARLGAGRLALFPRSSYANAVCGTIARENNRVRKNSSNKKVQKLARDCGEVRTYDILEAGPNNRFTVSNKLVHNCGYGGGVNALIKMGALEMGLTERELQPIITLWREANKSIVKFWYDVERAAKRAIDKGEKVSIQNGISFEYRRKYLIITLPSGRSLYYANASLVPSERGVDIMYWGMDQTTKKWCRIKTYSGKLVENIVQAVARDVLAQGLLNLDGAGIFTAIHVHDETVNECDDSVTLEQVNDLMCDMPAWAKGLPLAADGFISDYYKKD